MDHNEKITPLASIPGEHTRYEYKTYLSIPKWDVVFVRNDYFKFVKDNPNHLFPYMKAIRNYWKSYWIMDKFTKKKAKLKFMSHIKIIGLGLSISTEFGLKCIYEKTFGLLTYYLCDGKTEQDELIDIIGQEYAEFIKYHPWYEFDFFSRLWAFIKQLKNLPQNPLQILRKLERTFYFSTEISIKICLTLVVKILFLINYHQPNTRTAIELDYLPSEFENDSNVDIIGEHQKHIVISVPRYFEFKEYIKKISTDNYLYSIAGNTDETLICCTLPAQINYTLIKLEPILIQKVVYGGLTRVIYKIKIAELIKFKRFCELRNIALEHIFDF